MILTSHSHSLPIAMAELAELTSGEVRFLSALQRWLESLYRFPRLFAVDVIKFSESTLQAVSLFTYESYYYWIEEFGNAGLTVPSGNACCGEVVKSKH